MVELSACVITSLPNLGRRITLYVMVRFDVPLLSLVLVSNSSFVIGVDDPGVGEEVG